MIRLWTLGRVEVRADDGAAEGIPLPPKQVALLVYLAAAGGTTHRRDRLLGLLWPELGPGRARAALNQGLYRLRRALGPETVVSHGNEAVGVAPGRVWCDAAAFEEKVAEGRAEPALELYRGSFLDGFHLSGAAPFERWVDGRCAALRTRAVKAATELADRAQEENRPSAAERWLRKLRALAPADEEVARRLMRLLHRAGRRADALRVYGKLATHLEDELGLEPAPETRQLARELRARDDLPRSVAVLPFRHLDPDPDRDGRGGFGSGLAEEILTALDRIGSLRVVGGNSAARAAGGDGDLAEVAESLGVDALVEGSIRQSRDRIRVSARLVRSADGTTLWSDRYQLRFTPAEIFETQEEIARRIADELEAEIERHGRDRLVRRPTSDPEAYALYLEGRHAWRRRTPGSLREALRLFRASLDRDPGNALAWSGVADTHALLAIYGAVEREESYREAQEAAARALELDPTLAEARTSLARVHVDRHRWEEAERELRRALSIRQSYAPARHWLADHLMRTGRRDEALEEAERLVELEPLSPFALAGRGFLLYLAREEDAALEAAERSRSLSETAQGTVLHAIVLAERGEAEEALRVSDEASRRWPDTVLVRGGQAYAAQNAGQTERARELAGRLRNVPGGSFYAAMVHAADGAADPAFRLLEHADWTSPEVDFFVSGPAFDELRSDSRYREQLSELGLAEARSGNAASAG
jgi:serine/threonine-protein kinase